MYLRIISNKNMSIFCRITECGEGLYGVNCSQQCVGHCRDSSTCNHVTGQCDDGCDVGWRGSKCNEGCIIFNLLFSSLT